MIEVKAAKTPFIGARSYDEEDADIFFGREKEFADLFQLITINSFTLLYGRSGLGKTSLLKASIFPKLKKVRQLPIYIRLNYSNEKLDFVKEIENLIYIEAAREENSVTVDPIRSKESLWEYFHRNPLKDKLSGKAVTTVLVFDQFEEIFTLGTKDKSSELRENVRRMVVFLADLIENSPPQLMKEEDRLILQYQYGSKPIPIKILFSFREEYLSDFYSLSNLIPSIAYSNLQYRLLPLTYEKGYTIIRKASGALFEEDAISETLRVITESASLKEAGSRDIDSFILSIFCESQISQLKEGTRVTPQLVRDVDVQGLVNNLYSDIVKELQLNSDEKKLLEDKLLTAEGFRIPVYLSIAQSNPNVRIEKINGLEKKKIIKRYFVHGKPCIEIIHDKYANAIKKERDLRVVLEKEKVESERRLEIEKLESERKLEIEKIESERRLEIEKLESERKLEKEKIESERRLEIEKIESERRLEKEKFEYQRSLDEERQRNMLEKLEARKKKNRLLWAALTVSSLLILAMGYFYSESVKQARKIENQAEQLALKEATARKLNDSLQVRSSQLSNAKDSINLINEDLALKTKLANASAQAASKATLLARAEAKEARTARERADSLNVSLNASNYQLKITADSLSKTADRYLAALVKNSKAVNIGKFLSSAQSLQAKEPALAFRLAQHAYQLDSTDKQVIDLYNGLLNQSGYFEAFVAEGVYSTFSPKGNSIVMVDTNGKAKLLNTHTLKEKNLEANAKIFSAQYSPQGDRLLAVSTQELYLYDTAANYMQTISLREPVEVALFSYDGRNLITVSEASISIWSTQGKLLQRLSEKNGSILSVAAGPERIVMSTLSGVKWYDLAARKIITFRDTLQPRAERGSPGSAPAYYLFPSGQGFLRFDNNRVFVRNFGRDSIQSTQSTQSIKVKDLTAGYYTASNPVFSPDGTKVLLSVVNISFQQQQQQQQQQVQLRNRTEKQKALYDGTVLIDLEQGTARAFKEYMEQASFSAKGDSIIGFSYGHVRLYDLALMQKTQLPQTASVVIPQFSPRGDYIMTRSAGPGTSIKLWTYGKARDLLNQGRLANFSEEAISRTSGVDFF